jgi:hypothetical protein
MAYSSFREGFNPSNVPYSPFRAPAAPAASLLADNCAVPDRYLQILQQSFARANVHSCVRRSLSPCSALGRAPLSADLHRLAPIYVAQRDRQPTDGNKESIKPNVPDGHDSHKDAVLSTPPRTPSSIGHFRSSGTLRESSRGLMTGPR